MAFGLTEDGFVPKTIEDLRSEVNAEVLAEIAPTLDVSDGSVIGKLIGIVCERYAELWELAEAVHSSQDPDAATGDALDGVCALTGTVREDARPSTVSLILTGTTGTVVSAGSKASTDAGDQFETLEDVTLIAATAWLAETVYTLNQIRTNDGRMYIVTTAGTSDEFTGPTGTGISITDGTVTWRYIGEGTGVIAVDAESVEDGPIVGNAYTIDTIETPVSGWESVANIFDADLGALVEADEDLRVRRVEELSASGESPIDGIRANLLRVPGVTAVRVFHNTTNVTDADGVPAHHVEALVQGGEDQDIFDALHACVSAGIGTHGTETGEVTDSAGNAVEYKFSRPDEIEIYIRINLAETDEDYPDDGNDQVKAKIVEWGDAFEVDDDVISNQVLAQCFKVPGFVDADNVYIGTAPAPATETPIVICNRELAVFDTARIGFIV